MSKKGKEFIEQGRAILGIELGSTRIKAVLIDEQYNILATGGYEWESRYVEGVWTYDQAEIINGLQACYGALRGDVEQRYGVSIERLAALGISGMMHGYLVFDEKDQLLVPFRTWRNTITRQAADQLIQEFDYNIPQRWSIAHLYQAILNQEKHIGKIRYMTTAAGYIHYLLTGEKVMGIGEASGMFPIDTERADYNQAFLDRFDELVADKGYPWKIRQILPKVLIAGQSGGRLSQSGAALLDKNGKLKAGSLMCPPEGDAGTGMVATNSVRAKTGNVSAGTSIFAMIVLEKQLSKLYPEIDMVTTPDGSPVAMVHCNNCTADLNAWINLFAEFAKLFELKIEKGELFERLLTEALTGQTDAGGLISYNYYSGEDITKVGNGIPLFMRRPEAEFNLANFMRMHLFSSIATLKLGMDLLTQGEGVFVDNIIGHGGFFKTKLVGQKLMAAALDTKVSVMETAGEGGAFGIAVLAAYAAEVDKVELSEYLEQKVFADCKILTIAPEPDEKQGFALFMERYVPGLQVETEACRIYYRQ